MSDHEQAILAEAIETVLEESPVAAPLVRAREALDAALLEDAEYGREQARLKGARDRLRSQWRGAQQTEQGSLDERIAHEARELRQDLEQQAHAWQVRWEAWQTQRQAQSLRLLRATHAFRELAQQAEDALARVRRAVRMREVLQAQPHTCPFATMELASELEQYVAKLAALVGPHEAQALADDLQRVPSWRL